MASKAEKSNQTDIKIPVFSVLKKGITAKNIVLNAPVSSDASEGELILVGRHPDCQIVLDHPSISRFHLEVKVYTALQQLTVTDRSSVHGSWVSGIKIPPKTPIGLVEGDTVRLGASTREYRLQWLSMSEVVEMESPLEALIEGEETHQEEEVSHQTANPIPSAPPMPESMGLSSIDEPLVEIENHCPARKEFRLESSDLSVDPVQQFKSPKRASSNVVGSGRKRRSPSPVRSEKRVMSSSLLSRRSKSISHLRIHAAKEKEDGGSEAAMKETLCRVLFDSIDIEKEEEEEEETFDSDKENITPCSSKSLKFKKSCGELRISLMDASSSSNVEEDISISGNRMKAERGEAFDSYKENTMANTSSGHKSRKSILGLQRSSSDSVAAGSLKDNVFQSYIENSVPNKLSFASCVKIGEELNDEVSLDKENTAPRTSSGQKSRKSILGLQRSSSDSPVASNKIDGELDDEFPFDKENLTPIASGPLKSNKIFSKSQDRIEKQMMRKRVERVPFQSLLESSPSRNNGATDATLNQADCSPNKSTFENSDKKTTKREENAFPSFKESPKTKAQGVDSIALQNKSTFENSAKKTTKREENAFPSFKESPKTKAQGAMKNHDNSSLHHNIIIRSLSESSNNTTNNKAGEEKKTWNMVVDASCFLDEESRRSLQLLQGLRGTHLIIPRIVIRELDCLKRRESLFRKASYASSMLQWIERCMVSTSWWIHVQSSLEMAPVAATPPASPQSQTGYGRGEIGAAAMPFSTCGSLMEIVSPTSEDHILDCALMFRKLKKDERFVLLSDSVPLKIKAMAEGLLCETPTEFRESLVNPYSKRFLWASSSPRGSPWPCWDEAALNENCVFQPRAMRMTGEEGAKGLKLILLHNSQYGKTNSVK